ncbi:M57 family metalloprotease [Paenibacillus thiaminolyticus]|uniref:matrixin family metalloprotease n=1 Tax=Paenibacillus thiaminolyticus TaxID=49283 RepID=UPI00234FD631|nr:M57 family metalloprotease [Paenibacillus thiaminolyticus]WCR25818.1 M57 family metalloprotease [Paenibacillus thiaminolyticus]
MKFFKVIVLVLLLNTFICSLAYASSSSYSYNGYKWGKVSNLNVCMDPSTKDKTSSGDTYSSISNDAFSKWTSGLNNKIMFSDTKSSCQIYVQSYSYGNIDWIGQATYVPTVPGGSTFASVSIQLNRTYMDNYSFEYNRGIAAHEIGHSLGLSHVIDTSQIMCPLIDGRTVSIPNSGDITGVKRLYGL